MSSPQQEILKYLNNLNAELKEINSTNRAGIADVSLASQNASTNITRELSSIAKDTNELARRVLQIEADKEGSSYGHRWPDVGTFDGLNNKEFRPWVDQLRVFFITQPNKFKTDRERIFYTGNRLKGTALQWYCRGCKPSETVGTKAHPWDTWETFTEKMRDLFGRRDEEFEARQRLDRLVQGSRELVAFINELDQLDSILNLADDFKLHVFKRGLGQSLRDRLALWPTPLTKSADAIQAALQLNRQTEEFQSANRNNLRTTATNYSAAVAPAPTALATTAVSVPDPDAMEVDAAAVPRKPLTQEEKNRRRVEGLCNYCGVKGHIAAQCPSKQQRAPPRNSALPGSGSGN